MGMVGMEVDEMAWSSPEGYYRRAARSLLFISMFSGLSLLFACSFSPPAAILFLPLSFIRFISHSQPGMLVTL